MDSADSRRPEARNTTPPPRSRPRAIVLVEAEGLLTDFVRDSFAGSGFSVVLAPNVEGALREVQATVSVVAVVDDDLPLVRGLDLLGRLRAARSDLESVLVTRDDAVVSLVARLTVPGLQCLRKPLHLEELRESIAHGIDRLVRRERSLRRGVVASERVPREEPLTPSTPPGRDEGDGLRVLVVDDDPLVRRSMARTFRRHRVVTAENGRAAAAEIEREKPDVIISDLKMPEMDGFELAEEIRERWPDLANRIVFVSGTSSQIERARTEAPRQPLVTKPVNSHELEARMAEVLDAATRRR